VDGANSMPFQCARSDPNPERALVSVVLVVGSIISTESVSNGGAYSLLVVGANVTLVHFELDEPRPVSVVVSVMLVSGSTMSTDAALAGIA